MPSSSSVAEGQTRYAGRRRRRRSLCFPPCVSATAVINSDDEDAAVDPIGGDPDPCSEENRRSGPWFAWIRLMKRTKTVPMASSAELEPVVGGRGEAAKRKKKKESEEHRRRRRISAPSEERRCKGILGKLRKFKSGGNSGAHRTLSPEEEAARSHVPSGEVRVETRKLCHVPRKSNKHQISCHISIPSPTAFDHERPTTSAASASAAVSINSRRAPSRTVSRSSTGKTSRRAAAPPAPSGLEYVLRLSGPVATLAVIIFAGKAVGIVHLVLCFYLLSYLVNSRQTDKGGAANVVRSSPPKSPAEFVSQPSVEKQKQKVVMEGLPERKNIARKALTIA